MASLMEISPGTALATHCGDLKSKNWSKKIRITSRPLVQEESPSIHIFLDQFSLLGHEGGSTMAKLQILYRYI
jgi:hypothetical protein